MAGVAQAAVEIGAIAVRLVVDNLNRNERGVPVMPNTVLTPGRWVQGAPDSIDQIVDGVSVPAGAT